MSLGRPCSMRFKKLHFAHRGKNIFFKNNISLTWHILISLFCYYPPLKEDVTLHFNIFESPLYKDTLCQVWLKLAKWFLRRRFLKVVNVFSLCGYYLPLKKCMALNLNKFEFPLSKNTLCHVWLKLAQRFWRRFSKVVNIFQFLLLSPLRKRARSFNCKKLNPFNPRMVCAKFGWNWPGGSRE